MSNRSRFAMEASKWLQWRMMVMFLLGVILNSLLGDHWRSPTWVNVMIEVLAIAGLLYGLWAVRLLHRTANEIRKDGLQILGCDEDPDERDAKIVRRVDHE